MRDLYGSMGELKIAVGTENLEKFAETIRILKGME